MGPIMDFKTLLVLACVAAGSLAGPVRETQCAEECNSRDDEGMFRAFKSYYFSYAVDIDSRINGAESDQSSTVRVEATAVIEGLSACDMMLKFSDVSIMERRQDGIMVAAETSSTFSDALRARSLRFSMEGNGTITSLCPEAGEEIWALNVKRGFLSHIQTKWATPGTAFGQAGIFETSVTGTCMPVYSSTGEQTFTKSQDYLMCTYRTNLNMFVDAIPVHLLAPTASPLTSRMECEYEMDSQSISSVECHETHTLRPFAESESKPEAVVHTVITKTAVRPTITSSLSSEFARRTTLLYEDPSLVSDITSDDVRDTISQICNSITYGISSETPHLFETLTKQFGDLDTDNMNTVINRLFRICPEIETNEVINMVKDALTDCDTEQCAQGFHSIIQTENSAENGFYLRKWFMKLAFHKNPTKNMISLVRRHVSDEMNLQAYYALSAMIHQYCHRSEVDCSRDRVILDAASVFEDNLQDSCLPESEDDQQTMLMSLRAIGNMGLVQSKSLLNRCNREQNPASLRVAAIEAYRRTSCDVVPTDQFMRIFSTIENDSELRIAAYRAIIRCPSEELLLAINSTMAVEPTNQVTCYVSSHLANLRNSQDPMVADLQNAISESPLANVTKCGMDYRKFSHNYGLSYFDDESGNGIHFDSDVVFSSKSYLPKSARLAMNVDIFGYGINLFEVDARPEGWQEALESLTEFSEDDRESNLIEKVKWMMNKRVTRQKREAIKNTALNEIKKEYEASHVQDQEVSEKASIATRVLGNDVFYKDSDDIQRMVEMFSSESIMEIIMSLVTQRTHEYSLNKNFKTSKVTIPTMVGMPLEVNIQGALNTVMKASGKLDVMGMVAKPRRMAIQGVFEPRTYEYSLNKNFKTSKVIIPTMVGMPLEVNIQGALNTVMKASGKLDVMGMVAKPRRMAIQGVFEPSAAIEIHSNMMVDAHCARSGLSHKTNMATSLSLGGSLFFENSMLKAKVDTPPQRQTLISATSSLYFMQMNEMVPISEPEGAVIDVEQNLSSPRFNLHISGTRPMMPFSLPEALFHTWGMEISVDKLEDSLVSFNLEAGFRTDKAFRNGEIEKTDHLHLLIGTPSSETLGAYSMDLAYHRSNKTLIIGTESPKGSTYFIGSLRSETNSKRLHLQYTTSGRTLSLEAGMDTIPLIDGIKFVPVFVLMLSNIVSYSLEGHVSCTGEEKVWDLALVEDGVHVAKRNLVALKGDFIKNDTLRRLSLYTSLPGVSSSLQGGYRVEQTPSSRMITPIFSISTTFPSISLSIGGGPLVISDNGVTMNELYLTTTNTRLIEVSNLHLNKGERSFGFQGNIKETIPFGIEFDMTNDERRQYSVNLAVTSILGEYNIQGLLFNRSSEAIYRLEVVTRVNSTEYFNVISEFKNEINALQYLDTMLKFRGQQILRTKSGLQIQELNSKNRYTPIFILETDQLGSLSLEGSMDISDSGILINNMALVGVEDIFRLSGSASLVRDVRSVSWSFTVGGAYVNEVVSGSASHYENMVTFHTSMASDQSSSQPDYSITIDLQNSTKEGQIFSWDGKVELEMPHHPELSFRMDTEYILTPGRSTGNVFRLCYDGIDCTSTDKRITLSHDVTFERNSEIGMYTHDLEVTYTHPAVDKDVTLEWTTSCNRDVSYGTEFTVKDHEETLFTTSMTYIPEGAATNGSTNILASAPGFFDYAFTDTFHFNDPTDIFWLSQYRSGEDIMSFLVRFNMTTDENEHISTSTILEYTDIRNNAYTLEYIYATGEPGNTLNVMTIKKNSDLKIFMHQEVDCEQSETQILSRYIRVVKTTFQPVQDMSYNQTIIINPQNGNTNVELQLRFMPDQKPISLISDFTNKTTDSKKEGQFITTLRLPKTSITVLSEGKIEMGVPSANLSIKFLPLMGSTETYAVEFAMKNMSTSMSQSYDTALLLKSDPIYGLRHTLEFSEDTILPMTTTLTGFLGEEEVSVGSSLAFDEMRNMRTELDLSLSIPEHVYLFSGRFDMDSRNITITKDSIVIWTSNLTQDLQESDAGFTYNFAVRESVMGFGSETTLTLSSISNSKAFNLQVQENSREIIYADWALDLFPGESRFDLATESRSDYLPGYNTKTSLNFQKTEQTTTVTTSLNIDDNDVFSISFTNGSSDDPISRITQLILRQPTNPDLRLRQIVLSDSCSMTAGRVTHNTTVMWGNLLPTQTIALRFTGSRNDAGVGATVMLRNEGRVFGFGRWYTLALGKTKTGSDCTSSMTFTGEGGNIFSLQTEITNSSMNYMKKYETSVTMTVLDRQPITVSSSLVHNSSDTVLDADLTITYSTDKSQELTAGIVVTRMPNGHSIMMNLRHLVNTIDVTIIGTYSKSSELFEMTLENSVLLGEERHQPELSFSLNRATKEVAFMYTGSGNYGFSGQFRNRSSVDGRIYQIDCSNTYNGRVVPYSMIFNEPRRVVGMMVQFNPDNLEDSWEFDAGYINDSAISVSLDTVYSGQTIRNASIVLSLERNVPKVLTTQINWEPSWPQDLKAAVMNIINKTKELRDEKRAVACGNWKALAQRINKIATDFMLSNVNIYTQIQLLKTQVKAQWALNQPMRMIQLGNLVGKLMQFNQTIHANLMSSSSEESYRGYKAFAAQFEEVGEYFRTGFKLFSENVVLDWMTFEMAFQTIADQFNGTAIAAHMMASSEAKDAFYADLFEQFEEDIVAMDPNWEALKERLDTIGQNVRAVGPVIREEFKTRIAVLKSEKRAMKRIMAAIVEDIQEFNATFKVAAAHWAAAAERELEPFRSADFSSFVVLFTEFNETIHTLVSQEKAEAVRNKLFDVAFVPVVSYVIFFDGFRREAPNAPADTLNSEAIKAALARFNYGIPSVSDEVSRPLVPVMTEIGAMQETASRFNLTTIVNVLKKVINGTYELTRLDLMNGEIVFKIFMKDFSNYTSLTNLTRQYLDMLPEKVLNRINITKLEKMISMLHEGTLGEFKARFMEQFTPNGTRYEEMMQELQTRMQSGLQDTMETHVVPYLERLGDRIVKGGRPFFGRVVDMPDSEERSSFLEQLTDEMDMAGMERMMGRMKQAACGAYNTMKSTAWKVKMATCPRTWVPPYAENALVIGAKHYMTFDKQFYDFSGKCGYLLAKDFVHENDFSAIVDYERDMEIPIRNMMFMINSTTFEIKSDGTVRVDRHARELPLQVHGTAVVRIGDSIILKNSRGVSVVCKLPHDVCSLQLNGRYFDRTAGLLGNFNFEPFDDLKTPGNQLQTNITSFTESWKVGKNCIQSEVATLDRNRVIPSMDTIVNFDPLHPDNLACANMFLDNCSPLAQCHGGVDPDSFYRMCILDSRDVPEEERQTKMCSIAAAYRTQCWHSMTPVPMPDACITCKVGEETFQAGEPVKIQGDNVPRKVDVVFVVEEKRCAEQDADYLDNLVLRIAGELQDAGFNDTQFGLAAFGGSGVHDYAHQHTINHKIFNNKSREFPLGRDSLEFADDGSNDTFSAIKLAANYPFRAGAAKHIILLSCSECNEQDTKVSFKQLSVMLRKRAISLTMLMDYQFSLNKQFASKSKSKSKSEEVYGIDSNATYTSKMAGQEIFKGSGTLRQYTNEPDSVCALLAQESGGAIFDSTMLSDKGFNEVFVKRLVMKSEPAPCQICRCVPDGLVNVGRSVCEKCANPLNVFGEEIRAGVRDFELKYRLRHWRYADQIPDEEE